jgi:hypothetical protein
MEEYQKAFDNSDFNFGNTGVVNTGVIFVLQPERARQFLLDWWNFAYDEYPAGEEHNFKWPWEQWIVSKLLHMNKGGNYRKEVLLLDPSKYNGPNGVHIRHLYGNNKQVVHHTNSNEKDEHPYVPVEIEFTLRELAARMSRARVKPSPEIRSIYF